jgi:hypothetical protein
MWTSTLSGNITKGDELSAIIKYDTTFHCYP